MNKVIIDAIQTSDRTYKNTRDLDLIRDVEFAHFTDKKITYSTGDKLKHNLFLTTEILSKKLTGTLYRL